MSLTFMDNYTTRKPFTWSKEYLNEYLNTHYSNIDEEFKLEYKNQMKKFRLSPKDKKYENSYKGMLNECKVFKFLQILSGFEYRRMSDENKDNSNSIDLINSKQKILLEIKSVSYSSKHKYQNNYNSEGDYCYWFSKSKIDTYEKVYKKQYPDYKFMIMYFFTDGLYMTEYDMLDTKQKDIIKKNGREEKDNTYYEDNDKVISTYLYPAKHFVLFSDKLISEYPYVAPKDIILDTQECLL